MSDEDEVHLKKILGVKPGIYLAWLYSAILLVVCFFLFFFPGITRPGSMVTVTTEPEGAAFRVNDVYMGTSPCRVFVPEGRHTVELVLPGFTPVTKTETISSSLFGSLFFPRRHYIEGTLNAPLPVPVLAGEASDFAAWSFAGEPTAAWQIPLSLSNGAYLTGASAKDPKIRSEMNEIIKAAGRFGVTKAGLRDLIRAKALIDNGGIASSPISLLRSTGDIISWLQERPGASQWLAETIPGGAEISGSAWYMEQLMAGEALYEQETLAPFPAERLSLGPLSFDFLNGGTLAASNPFPRIVHLGGFWMSETEANPPDPGGITWDDAAAYCTRLSGLLPSSMQDWEVRLPTEAEWEYAAKSAWNWNSSPFTGLSDGLWEWCADPYVHLPFLPASGEAVEAVSSPERPVRGGAPANEVSAGFDTRSSLPPSTVSPFVSFRPVIALKNTAGAR
jgi:hypothetical protein